LGNFYSKLEANALLDDISDRIDEIVVADSSNVKLYPLSSPNNWSYMGALTTTQTGQSTTFDISTTDGYQSSGQQHRNATMQFVSANGTNYRNGVGGPFYGQCSHACFFRTREFFHRLDH
jgi:hypothetical protein